jgi:hypothetical protein
MYSCGIWYFALTEAYSQILEILKFIRKSVFWNKKFHSQFKRSTFIF